MDALTVPPPGMIVARMFSCNGGAWTQATDVEGEVNGLLTYDCRILRTDVK